MTSRLADPVKYILLCASLLTVLAAGCTHMDGPAQTQEYVKLSFSAQGLLPTRSGDNRTSGIPAETRIHSLQVWAFNSGTDQLPLGYGALAGDDLARITDAYGNVSLIIPVERERLSGPKQLDFYVAANASAAGVTLGAGTARSGLEQAVFGSFRTEEPVHAVPADGLPVSRIIKSVDAERYLSTASNPAVGIEIPLVRAVSKLHFYLARPKGLDGAAIQRIVLDGDAIPQQSYFFPPAAEHTGFLPESGAIRLPGEVYDPSEIVLEASALHLNAVPDPARFVCGPEEDLQDYVDRLAANGFRDCGLCYLHETDRALTGTIYYTTAATGTAWQQTSFRLDAGHFARGRAWIIYAFFDKDRLLVHPVVADWTDAGVFAFDWHYTSTLINQTGTENTRILTREDGSDYVMSAYGSGPSGLPLAPKLMLEAACTGEAGARMLLQLDNPDFCFIKDDGGVLSDPRPFINIELSPTLQAITFYVVPRRPFDLAGSNPENPVTKLSLLLFSDFLTSIRLPFNAVSLPGDADHIRFHYVTPDQFR